MSNPQKRIITIQDISCVGRCSITVALPILSAAGFETSILPTAVLSTHTGGFKDWTYADLTGDFEAISTHWKSLDLQTDAIYTGYLGSIPLIEKVVQFASDFKGSKTIFAVDPAFGDQGKLYPAFDDAYVAEMRKLSASADLIMPNLTEAAYLLDEPYSSDMAKLTDEPTVKALAERLAATGPSTVIITGVSLNAGELGAVAYDKATNSFDYYAKNQIEGYYHGTGDIFSSAALAGLLRFGKLKDAIKVAVEFTHAAIKRTHDDKTDAKYGVAFEPQLGQLIELLK